MNERINELAEEAEINFESHPQHQGVETAVIIPADLEKFAELIIQDYATKLVQANMSNRTYARAMDAYYEEKWAHRFD